MINKSFILDMILFDMTTFVKRPFDKSIASWQKVFVAELLADFAKLTTPAVLEWIVLRFRWGFFLRGGVLHNGGIALQHSSRFLDIRRVIHHGCLSFVLTRGTLSPVRRLYD